MDVGENELPQTEINSTELERDDGISEENISRKSQELNSDDNKTEVMEFDETSVAPRFVIHPKDTYIQSNQTGFIEARIYSVPKPIVRWYQNGQLITSSQFPKIKKHHYEPETYILEIPEATASDIGSYSCVARNCHGSTSSSAASLRIIDLEIESSPQFLNRLKRTDVLADTNGRLEVKVSGEPKPKVEWLKNLIPLKETNRIKMSHREPNNYVLLLKNAEPEDTGLYTCQARNDLGTTSTTAMVSVENTEYFKKKMSQDLALLHVRNRKCPIGWSQRELDDYLYRVAVANYQIKYRKPCGGYIDLF